MFGFFIDKIVKLTSGHLHLSKTIETIAAVLKPLFTVAHLIIRILKC